VCVKPNLASSPTLVPARCSAAAGGSACYVYNLISDTHADQVEVEPLLEWFVFGLMIFMSRHTNFPQVALIHLFLDCPLHPYRPDRPSRPGLSYGGTLHRRHKEITHHLMPEFIA